MRYKKFSLMLIIFFIVIYTTMFLNVDSIDHVYLSLTRLNMTILMIAPMALIMLLLMGKMYPNKKLNLLIVSAIIVVFITSFVLLRNQAFVGDRQKTKAMIPHHSSAIIATEHAAIVIGN